MLVAVQKVGGEAGNVLRWRRGPQESQPLSRPLQGPPVHLVGCGKGEKGDLYLLQSFYSPARRADGEGRHRERHLGGQKVVDLSQEVAQRCRMFGREGCAGQGSARRARKQGGQPLAESDDGLPFPARKGAREWASRPARAIAECSRSALARSRLRSTRR